MNNAYLTSNLYPLTSAKPITGFKFQEPLTFDRPPAFNL